MSLILKKFIGDDQVDGAKILLDNNQALRADSFLTPGTPINIMKVDVADRVVVQQTMYPASDLLNLGSSSLPFNSANAKNLKVSDGAVDLGGLSFNNAVGIDALEFSSATKNVSVVSTTGNVSIVAQAGLIQMIADAVLYNSKKLTFNDADGSNQTSIKAAAVTTESVSYSLPAADGDSGQFLTTDGAGQMSWTSPEAAAQWNREMLNIDGSNQVTLAHEPIPASLIVFVDGVMMRYGVDYEVNAGAATKLDFNLAGAEPTIVAGDDIYIQYQY